MAPEPQGRSGTGDGSFGQGPQVGHDGFAPRGEAVAGLQAFSEAEGFEAADVGLEREFVAVQVFGQVQGAQAGVFLDEAQDLAGPGRAAAAGVDGVQGGFDVGQFLVGQVGVAGQLRSGSGPPR